MKIFKIGETEWNLPNSWEDMTLENYIDFFLFQDANKEREIDDLYMIEVFEIITKCDDVLDIPIDELKGLLEELVFLAQTPELTNGKTIIIDDKLYGCVDLNTMTTGEYISIKTLMGNEKTVLEGLPRLLAIIIRPAEEVKDLESGEMKLKIEKFSVENLGWRAEKFKGLKVVDVLHWISFFLTGKGESSTIIRPSTKVERKKETHGHQ
jgi:hypothetical protein